MTRIAPIITLLAVAAVGGALFVTTAMTDPATRPTPVDAAAVAAAQAPAEPARTEVSLADLPVVGAETQDRTELSLADLPVVGAETPAGRTEISLADIPVAEPPAAEDGVYAGRTADRDYTVAIAISDGEVSAYVCGGGFEGWFAGSVEDGTLRLEATKGTATMTGTVDGETVEGRVTVDGTTQSYAVDATTVADAVDAGRDDVAEVAARVGLGS